MRRRLHNKSVQNSRATRKHIGNWRPKGNGILLAARRYVEIEMPLLFDFQIAQ